MQVLRSPFVTYAPVINKSQINLKLTAPEHALQSAISCCRMLAQIRVQSGIAMDRKRKANILEDEIRAMVEEIEDMQHVFFGGQNSGLTKPNRQLGSVLPMQ